jgi:hypothetical protein
MPIASPEKSVHLSLLKLLVKLRLLSTSAAGKVTTFSEHFPIAFFAREGLLKEDLAIAAVATELKLEQLVIDHEVFSSAVNLLDNPALVRINNSDWMKIKAAPIQL